MKVLKVPFSSKNFGKGSGSELGPEQIVKELKDLYVSETYRNLPLEFIEIPIDLDNIEITLKNIEESIPNEYCIILGGEHTLSFGSIKKFLHYNPEGGLIIFDAHPDLENNFFPPTQEDYLRVLIEQGLNPEKIILIGLRNWDQKEIDFLRERKIKHYTMRHIYNLGIKNICDTITEIAFEWPAYYLSIDIDCVDPAFAPGTGYCEPGGLTSRELIYFIQRLKKMQNLRMVDIVEINPKKDINNMTSKLGAKLIKELQ